jgi:hypothetical protein
MIGNPPLVFNQIRALLEAHLFKTSEIYAICLRTARHSRVASFLFLRSPPQMDFCVQEQQFSSG